jgi:hypothetical protein
MMRGRSGSLETEMVMQSACRMVHGRCSVSAAQAASSALTCGECGVRFLSRDLDPGAFAFDNLYPTVGGYRSINYRNCGCGACRSLTRGVQSAAARGVRWACGSGLSAPYTTGSRQRGAVGVLCYWCSSIARDCERCASGPWAAGGGRVSVVLLP